MGVGSIHSKCSKQKLNAKRSTETEIIGASDYIPWTLLAQGYVLRRNVFFQDNMSAMKLESNWLKSCGEKSRKIDIRFFFIKDVLKRENIELKHCPTVCI